MLVIQGVIFVITVLLFRRGIVGEIIALANRFQSGQGGERGEPAGQVSARPAE